jgi:hypothetical protein
MGHPPVHVDSSALRGLSGTQLQAVMNTARANRDPINRAIYQAAEAEQKRREKTEEAKNKQTKTDSSSNSSSTNDSNRSN